MKPELSHSILIFLFVLFGLNPISNAQNVAIPDVKFKAILVANHNINTNADGEIQVAEAAAYQDTIVVRYEHISDLTGIEAFTDLKGLRCDGNQLMSLDITDNSALEILNCGDNQLASLNVSSNTLLKGLKCYSNQLTSLNLSANSALQYLDCSGNRLTNLNISDNKFLLELICT